MKIKIFLLSLLSVVALTVTAQGLSMKAIVIHKTDGSKDTVLWRNAWGDSYETAFYGKETPVDDDYVTLHFSISQDYQITYRCSLTDAGNNTPHGEYGAIISTEHINSVSADKVTGAYIYFIDKQYLYRPDDMSGSQYIITPANVKKYFNFMPGQTFYVRAAFVLDSNVYYSSEIEARAPKTRSIMHELVYPNYQAIGDNIIFASNAESVVGNNPELFGTPSESKRQLYTEYLKKSISGKDIAALQAMATKTEECDDGSLYIIEEIPSTVTDEALQMMKDELSQPFYVQANLENVYVGKATTTEFGTYKCTPTIVVTDEKWGIRDNQYLTTVPQLTTGQPRLAILIDHLMQLGKKYDVTLIIAPNTQNEADTCNTYFTVYMADKNEDGSMPALTKKIAYGSDTTIGGYPAFIAKPQELTSFTIQYTPTVLTQTHVLQLKHIYTFFSAANRARYGQQFRVVGIEVKPHVETGE